MARTADAILKFGYQIRVVKMEPHRQACGPSCYAQMGDILSKEHSPTAKAVVLCVGRIEIEKYNYQAILKLERR